MIIRSQNGKVICNFGPGCIIHILDCDEEENGKSEYLICMSHGCDDCDLGYYSAENEAMKIIDNIFLAAADGKSFYEMP